MINIRAKGKCPICNKAFKADKKFGFFCPEHMTTPQRFQIDFRYKSERIRRETTFDGRPLKSFAEAYALLKQAENEIAAHRFDPSRWSSKERFEFRFDNLIMRWYQEKEILMKQGKLAPSYVPKLMTYIKHYFMPEFALKDAREITSVDIKGFYLTLPAKGLKGILSLKYQKNVMNALEGFFNWLHDLDVIVQMPKFQRIEVPEHEPILISSQEQAMIMAYIPAEHKPIFAFLFNQGCRPSEVRALKWIDIDLVNDLVTIRRTFSAHTLVNHTKTKKIRPNYLFPETKAHLPVLPGPIEWCKDRFVFTHGKTMIRPYSDNLIHKIYNTALDALEQATGIKIDSPLYEATKYSFGTNMVNDFDVPTDVVQVHYGHTSKAMTQRYAKLNAAAALKKAVTKRSPTPLDTAAND